jgi:hypothetical protein
MDGETTRWNKVTLPLNNRALSAGQDLYRKFRTPV